MIFLIGDVHGNYSRIYDWIDRIADRGDTLISVGDFGVGFVPQWLLTDVGEEAARAGVNILAIKGNHDDPQPFRESRTFENLRLIPDYSIMNIEGKDFFFIGGAISIDRVWRIEGKSYWKDEAIVEDLSKVRGVQADIVVTHSAPSFCNPTTKDFSNIQWAIDADPSLKEELPKERAYLTEVYETLCESKVPESWWYGHFHTRLTENYKGTKFTCLDIDQLHNL